MKYKIEEKIKDNIIAYVITGIILISFYFVIKNFTIVKQLLWTVFDILFPFICGFSFAFILLPIQKWFERLMPKTMKYKTKRKLSVTFCMFVLFAIVCCFLGVLIPQLVISATRLSEMMSYYIVNATAFIAEFTEEWNLSGTVFDFIIKQGEGIVDFLINSAKNYLPQVVNISISVIIKTFNFLIGIIICVYILLEHERFQLQMKKITFALLPGNVARSLCDITALTSRMFNRFIIGKLIDSLIIGLLCFIGMSILGFDYVLLISFIIGLTNMIPVFGPFIGAVPGIFILFIVHPIDALWFSIFVLVLQQFDGNILGPYILGDSMGLPSLWVMFAIIVGGGLFGIVGMFLGVPVFAVIYFIVKLVVSKQLKSKHIEL